MLQAPFVVALLCGLTYFTCLGTLQPELPRYVSGRLAGGGLEVGLVVAAFTVGACALRIPAGRLADRFGDHNVVRFGALIVAVSVGLYGLADNVQVLVLLRLATGVGEAGTYVGLAKIVYELAPPSRRGEATSYFTATLFGGYAVGPIIGEAMRHSHGFTGAWIAGAASALLAVGLSLRLPKVAPPKPAGVAGSQRYSRAKRRPMRLQHEALGPATILAVAMAGYAAFNTFIPLYVGHLGLRSAGPVLAENAGICICVRLFGARLPDALGPRRSTRLSLVLQCIGWATVGMVSSRAALYGGVASVALGVSFLYPALFSSAVARAPLAARANAVATFSMFFDLANGVGAVMMGAVVAVSNDDRLSFITASLLSLLALTLARLRQTWIAPVDSESPDGFEATREPHLSRGGGVPRRAVASATSTAAAATGATTYPVDRLSTVTNHAITVSWHQRRRSEMFDGLQLSLKGWLGGFVEDAARLADEVRGDLRRCTDLGEFPREIYREMGRRGWIGPFAPTTLGGLGGGVAEYCVVEEEIARNGLVSPQISIQGQRWLLDWGTEEQQDRYLGPLATGDLIFSEAISEPGVGSSLKLMRATARRQGTEWVLNGDKTHVNLGAQCDLTLLFAVAEAGLSAFLVDTDRPGVSAKQTNPIGLRLIPTADMQFRDVRVPSSALLGEAGNGLQTFLSTFNVSRLGNASELIGFARRALADAISYARQREVAESRVTDFQGIQWIIADRYADLYAAALARNQAATAFDRGDDPALPTSLAKKLATDAAERTVNDVFGLTGGYGLYHDRDFGQILHDVKVLRVAGGSLEVLRNYIARRVLAGTDLESS